MKKKKRTHTFLSGFLAVSLFLTCFSSFGAQNVLAAETWEKMDNAIAYRVDTSTAIIDNELTYADPVVAGEKPVIVNDYVMVPVEFAQNGTDATDFNRSSDGSEVAFKMNGCTYKFTADSTTYYVDNKPIETLVAPIMLKERLYMPVKLLADLSQKELFYYDDLIILSDTTDIYDPSKDKEELAEINSKLNELPIIGTEEKFLEMAGNPEDFGNQSYYPIPSVYDILYNSIPFRIADRLRWADQEPMPVDSPRGYGFDDEYFHHDYINVNYAKGVEAGDTVYTDGEYIYSILGESSSLQVFKADPADSMELIYEDKYILTEKQSEDEQSKVDESYYEYAFPVSMYVDKDYLTVILSADKVKDDIYTPTTMVKVYDIRDKNNITISREFYVDGFNMNISKVGNELYMFTGVDLYSLINGTKYNLPSYYDSAIGEEKEIGYEQISYMPSAYGEFYLASKINLEKPDTPATVSAMYSDYMNELYVTPENIYMYTYDYSYYEDSTYYGGSNSNIYKFSLDYGAVKYQDQCIVEGEMLHYGHLSEYNGNLRVVSNTFDDEGNSVNKVYVLDSNMDIIGQTECFTESQDTYYPRFFEERLYLEPNYTEQPIYAIDLQNPTKPEVLGEMSIPGDSNYIRLYDENHLLGFSLEKEFPEEKTSKEVVKMTMFDITDSLNPVEMFTQVIGDKGTYSDTIYDSNSMLIDAEKNLLAFPIYAYKYKEEVAKETPHDVDVAEEAKETGIATEAQVYAIPMMGAAPMVRSIPQTTEEYESDSELVFQGVYVYDVDFGNGFTKKGEITHMSEIDMTSEDYYEEDYLKQIHRVINIDDVLYTISRQYIKATDINTMQDISEIDTYLQ